MKPRYRLSRDAVALIERFEGFRAKATPLETGGWTVGYGHTKSARKGVSVSHADAEALLLYDLIPVSQAVNDLVLSPLNQNQFDALVVFAFSIGVKNFESSTVLRRLNEGRLLEAAYAMEMWRKARVGGETILVDALARRRAAEKALFLTPPEGLAPTSSALLRPLLDLEVIAPPPRENPVPRSSLPRTDASLTPSASETAAAALRARLEGLLSEAPQSESQNADLFAPVAEPEVEPEPVFELVESEIEIAPVETSDLPPGPFEDASPEGDEREFFVAPVETPRAPQRSVPRDGLSLGLLIVGLIAFLGGLQLALHGAPTQAPAGWIIALGGAVAACAGFYRLLQRILEEMAAA